MLQPHLDTQLSSSRHKPSKGPGVPGQFGVGRLSHPPTPETAFQNTTARPLGVCVSPPEQLCLQLRDAVANLGMTTASKEKNKQIPLCFCPCLCYLPGICHSFCIDLQREKTPFPSCPRPGYPKQGGPVNSRVCHGGLLGWILPRSEVTDRPASLLQRPSKWEQPSLCPAQGWGNGLLAGEAFYSRA